MAGSRGGLLFSGTARAIDDSSLVCRNNPGFNLALGDLKLQHGMVGIIEQGISASMSIRLQKTLSIWGSNWIHWLVQNKICVVPNQVSREPAVMRGNKSMGPKETRLTGTNSFCRSEATLLKKIHT
jgi:hypothetical protein